MRVEIERGKTIKSDRMGDGIVSVGPDSRTMSAGLKTKWFKELICYKIGVLK